MTLAEAVELFMVALRGQSAATTVEWYEYKLRPLLADYGARELASVTIHLLYRWRARVAVASQSPHTLRSHVRAVRALFRWCQRSGLLEENPATGLTLPPLPEEPPKAASEAAIQAMVREALRVAEESGDPWAWRDAAILLVLAETGCRVSGLCGLRLEDVDMERGEALVREKGCGGNRKARLVWLGEASAWALREWLERRPRARGRGGHVFLSQRARTPLTRSGVRRVLERLAGAAQVEGRWNPHSLRHAYGRRLQQRGASASMTQKLMGHSDPETTLRYYARWYDAEAREAQRRYGQIKPEKQSEVQ